MSVIPPPNATGRRLGRRGRWQCACKQRIHGRLQKRSIAVLVERDEFPERPTRRGTVFTAFLLKISILWTIGIIVLIIGVVLVLLGATGRAVGGRRHYF